MAPPRSRRGIETTGLAMLEVEVRYRVPDRHEVVAKLQQWGATLAADRTDVDQYFNPPDRELKDSDEAFRLRRIGPGNFLTYKGPRRDAETKTRTEIEVPLADGAEAAADMEDLLRALRFRPVVVVRKRRQVYRFTRGGYDVEVCFDDVERVGPFVELEILAGEDDYEPAKALLLQTAAELGLTDRETRSYLGMVLEALAREAR
jgi:adenylate cyclase class 2